MDKIIFKYNIGDWVSLVDEPTNDDLHEIVGRLIPDVNENPIDAHYLLSGIGIPIPENNLYSL